VVDRFTKYAHFIVLTHPYSANDVAQVFFDHFYKNHGLSSSIVAVTNRGYNLYKCVLERTV
jgi:hypothetical protein